MRPFPDSSQNAALFPVVKHDPVIDGAKEGKSTKTVKSLFLVEQRIKESREPIRQNEFRNSICTISDREWIKVTFLYSPSKLNPLAYTVFNSRQINSFLCAEMPWPIKPSFVIFRELKMKCNCS